MRFCEMVFGIRMRHRTSSKMGMTDIEYLVRYTFFR